MAFLLYRRGPVTDGLELLTSPEKVAFGGYRNGILYQFLRRSGLLLSKPAPITAGPRSSTEKVIPWHTSIEAFQKTLGRDPQRYRLIIDLKPRVKIGEGANISLFEIRHIWGVSYPIWTPVMLELRALFIDKPVPEGKRGICKERFLIDPDPRRDEPVFDLLYLNGGHLKGDWRPASPGAYNGVLLWPETARYFSEAIYKRLSVHAPDGRPTRHRLLCLESGAEANLSSG